LTINNPTEFCDNRKVELKNSAGQGIVVKQEKVVGAKVRSKIAVSGLGPGQYQVLATLLDASGRSLSSAASSLVKLSPRANEVKIDRERRCILVKGKPFFPIMIWHAPVDCLDDVVEDAGFNTVFWLSGPSWSNGRFPSGRTALKERGMDGLAEVLKRAFDEAYNLGLKAVSDMEMIFPRDGKYYIYPAKEALKRWENSGYVIGYTDLAWEMWRFYFETIKDHPATLFHQCIEEAPATRAPLAEKLYQCTRAVDLYHPVFYPACDPSTISSFGNAADILATDPYVHPGKGGLMTKVARYADIVNRTAVPLRKPTYIVLKGSMPMKSARLFTPPEQVCNTYLAVTHGAKGLGYFAYKPMSPAHWDQIKRLTLEVKELAPILCEADPEQNVTLSPADSPIHWLYKEYKRKRYLITVNTSNRPVDTEFSFPGISRISRVKVWFEKSKIRGEGNSFGDRWQGYERHVYEF